MSKSYWIVVKTPENFSILKKRKFDMVGLTSHHRKKVQRMEPDDRVLIYISHKRCFAASTIVTSSMVEDSSPMWQPQGSSQLPFRVGIKPDIILAENQFIEAQHIAPRMDYIKRWTPELWHLAFQDTVHLISKADFYLIEHEMLRSKTSQTVINRQASNQYSNLSGCILDTTSR
ncbi:EVE domain-containing protein [SAR202 cluster bacterium AC-409-J13_OGT_754m]|nr:EVE domain-containing protein [SAR202 cluster bacterium AC-409-J13_OGT_754m]